MKKKLFCPKCGEEISFHYMKNKFSPRVTCAHCKESLYVENKMFPYIIIAIMLLFVTDTIFVYFDQINLQGFLRYLIVFIVLSVVCIFMTLLIRTVFGAGFLYKVRSRTQELEEQQRIEKMREELRKSKSREKKKKCKK